ncbi:MAG TPA: VOC family protein [Acidimicrobiales bacterium]|nr:VOC family protein [Acidimicrobiales bacterium]
MGDFEFRGINHLALVCRDMAETIEFYEGVLGMPLVFTIDLPNDGGQHFFFDAGNETLVAFFWFPNAPEAEPGRVAPALRVDQGDFTSAIGSMNHLALTVPADRFDEKVELLRSRGVDVSEVLNHDFSERQITRRVHDGVWLRSAYFWDPNGMLLELATFTRPFTAADVRHDPRTSTGETVALDRVRRPNAPTPAGGAS